MSPFWQDDHMTLYGGDCRAVMAGLPAQSVHCVVTSPPYWGLRDYGTATWEGGEEDHAHVGAVQRTMPPGSEKQASSRGSLDVRSGDCICGARRIDSQLGLEPTPEEYVANMVAVFREVRRVLRDDGTVWLNLGDSYAVNGGARTYGSTDGATGRGDAPGGPRRAPDTLKPKDLVGIPWRVAFALQADGWYLRSDIIWSKPNPMPESVTDRPTKAHEYLFLLTKSPRYYYDADAVREGPAGYERKGGTATYTADGFTTNGVGSKSLHQMADTGRNLRSVWTIATEPYPGAHFATFPRKLVEPCVKAGCPEGGTVLDPFAGSGTTLLVAQALGRKGIGIDLSPEYLQQALVRNAQTPLGLVG